MSKLSERLSRLERDAATHRQDAQCDYCRDWPSVCSVTLEEDGTEAWATEQPHQCPRCGWVATCVTFEIVSDWRNVALPRTGR